MNEEELKCWICHRTETEAQEESGLVTSDGQEFYQIKLRGNFDYKKQVNTKTIDVNLCSICAAIFQNFFDIIDEYNHEQFGNAIFPGDVLKIRIEEEIKEEEGKAP